MYTHTHVFLHSHRTPRTLCLLQYVITKAEVLSKRFELRLILSSTLFRDVASIECLVHGGEEGDLSLRKVAARFKSGEKKKKGKYVRKRGIGITQFVLYTHACSLQTTHVHHMYLLAKSVPCVLCIWLCG